MSNGASPDKKSSSKPAKPRLKTSDIADWLRDHPDFLVKNPELLSVLVPPSRSSGDGVVDMQQFIVERQRRELNQLRDTCQELLAIGRANMATQTAVHASVLAILGARTFEHLIDIVTNDVAAHLHVDMVTIGVEADTGTFPGMRQAGICVLEKDHIDRILGEEQDCRLEGNLADADPALFGPASGIIRSAAYARLNVSEAAPKGILAIGSREEDFFHPKQASDQLVFFARIVANAIRMWLDLPHPAAIPAVKSEK